MTDVLIIGAGPAGLTAAIYAARAGVSVKVFDRFGFGGQTALTSEVDNYPGMPGVQGTDFALALYNHATSQGAEIVFEDVISVDLTGKTKVVQTAGGTHEGRTVILAGGAQRRELGCPGEAELKGRGVSYCATCDAAFFRGKTVAIVGGGDTALNDALFLSNQCEKVYLIHRRNEFRAQKVKQDAVRARLNVEFITPATVKEVKGTDKVEGCVLDVDGEERTLAVAGIFVAIGVIPDTAMYPMLKKDSEGYILAMEDCMTGVDGVYVAGDIRLKPLRQIVTAACDGAVAGVTAAEYVNGFEHQVL